MEKSSFQKRLCRLLRGGRGSHSAAVPLLPVPFLCDYGDTLSRLRNDAGAALRPPHGMAAGPSLESHGVSPGPLLRVCRRLFPDGADKAGGLHPLLGDCGRSSAGSVAAPASVYHLRRFPAVHPAGESGGFSGFPVSLLTDGYRGICFCPFCPESVLTGIRNLWEHPNSLYCFPVD